MNTKAGLFEEKEVVKSIVQMNDSIVVIANGDVEANDVGNNEVQTRLIRTRTTLCMGHME